jgi:hypothetical protein
MVMKDCLALGAWSFAVLNGSFDCHEFPLPACHGKLQQLKSIESMTFHSLECLSERSDATVICDI